MGAFRLRGQTSKVQVSALQTRLETEFRIFTVVRNDLASGACIRVTPQVFTPFEHVQALADAIVEISVTG